MNNVVKEVSTSNESPAVSTSNESPAVSTSNESPATGIQAVDKINDVGREKPVENSKPFEWKNVPWKSIITLIMFLCVFIVIYPRMDSIFSMIKDLVGLPAAVLDLLQKVWNDIQRDVDPTDPHFWGILIAGIPLAGIAGIAWVFRKVGGDKVDPDMEKILETTGTTKEDYSKEKIEKIKESTDSFKKENNKEKLTKEDETEIKNEVELTQLKRFEAIFKDNESISAKESKEIVTRKIKEKTQTSERLKKEREERERIEREKRERIEREKRDR